MNVATELIDGFRERREHVAVIDARGRKTTYAELLQAIARGRTRIERAGLAPHSRVIVQAPKGVPFASAAIALAAAGHSVIGIEMAQGDAVYRDRAHYVDANAVISTRLVRKLQRSDAVRLQLGRLGIEIPPPLDLPEIDWDAPAEPARFDISDVDPESIAFVVFTGGTTEKPKGVQLSHRAVRAYLAGLTQLPEWGHVASLVADHPQQVLYGLAHGKAVYLSPARASARAEHTANLLFDGSADCYFGAPALWHQILGTRAHQRVTAWPKAILLGGAPVTRSTLELLKAELPDEVAVRCLYGMSEAGLIAHISGPDKLALLRAGVEGDPVGEIADGVTLTVADDDELQITSPSLFSGYVGDPAVGADDRFATGDIGTHGPPGLRLFGRKKNMIVQQGVNLYAEQFEARLLQQQLDGRPAFDDVALVPSAPDELGEEHFVLFYSSSETTTAHAQKIAADVLPAGHEPRRVVRLSELPRTGRQAKIDRRSLAQLDDGGVHAMHHDLFEHLFTFLPAKGSEPRRAKAMHALTRRNLAAAERLQGQCELVQDPVFILGHQRSGTTLLHHALAASPDATALRLTDMLFLHGRAWSLATPIAGMAQRVHALSQRSQRWHDVFDRHNLDPSAPEEEEWLLAALGLSGYLPSAFVSTLGAHEFDRFRDRAAWPEETRRQLISLYASVISAWHAQRRGPAQRHVAKNPAFGPLAGDLLQAFPAARFIVALREPREAIASRLSLISAIHGRPLRNHEVDVVVDDSVRQLNGLGEQLRLLPTRHVHLVDFRELMAAPGTAIDQAASFAGLAPPARLPGMRPASPLQDVDHLPSAREIAERLPAFMPLVEPLRVAS